jgi:hypothetical protein
MLGLLKSRKVSQQGWNVHHVAVGSTYCQGVSRIFYGVYRVSEAEFGRNLARLCIQTELLESE